jgi:dienelactone hydrolase
MTTMAAGRQRIGAFVLAVVTPVLLMACTATTKPMFTVDRPDALIDQAVRIQISGLPANQPVTVAAEAATTQGPTWRAEATFVADPAGVVDLTTAVPDSGSYQGVDGMGLFWSMDPDGGSGDTETFVPESVDGGRSYAVSLSATVGGDVVASTTVRRVFTAADVTVRELTLDADGLLGTLFTPPAGSPRRPGVLLLGGSEGGPGPIGDAALLASHGYPALALSYFAQPGLPATLRDIPLEYFAAAARRLGQEPSVDAAGVVVRGYSRGTEAAMLLAEFFPELVRGVILYAPTDRANAGFPDGAAGWTVHQQPVPVGPLAVDQISQPVLAIAGGVDLLWPSSSAAGELKRALDAAHPGVRHEVLVYPDAGHGVGTYPYIPRAVAPVHPLTQEPVRLGGSRPTNEWARADGYPKMLSFLEDITRSH